MTGARGEAAYAAEFALWCAEEARRRYGATLPGGATADARIHLLHQPLGVVAAVTPWNCPLVLVLCASGVHAPQGGIKQGGIGLEGGSAGVDEFAHQKYVSIGL